MHFAKFIKKIENGLEMLEEDWYIFEPLYKPSLCYLKEYGDNEKVLKDT